MFSHVRDALEAGEVVLDKADLTGPGDDRPLVKDKYGSERRKAKTLNFSIAYARAAALGAVGDEAEAPRVPLAGTARPRTGSRRTGA